MTSKDVSNLYPLTFGESTPAQLVDALDSIQVLWHFVLQALNDPTVELGPAVIASMNGFSASGTALAAQSYAQLAVHVDKMVSQPDRYRHDDGPVADCLNMAAANLREACNQTNAVSYKLDYAASFTGCVHEPKDQGAQHDS